MTRQSPTPDNLDPVGDATRPWFAHYPPGVAPRIAAPAERSLGELAGAAARNFGDRTAFSNLGGTLSFRQVDEAATRIASYLQHELGLAAGDRIVLQMPNLLQYPVALYGALRAGLVVVNANPLYTAAELAAVVADAEPRAMIVLANFADKAASVVPGSSIEHIVVTEAGDMLAQPKRTLVNLVAKHVKKMVPEYSLPGAIAFRRLLTGDPARFADPGIGPDDLAFLQYTGGTTGGTKAAMLTHGNLLANQEQFIGEMRAVLESDSTVVAALPLYHVFALTVNCIGFFRLGGHNVLITNPRDIPAFVKTIDAEKPHALVLVSTLAGALLENPDFAKADLSRLRISVAGGMALRSAVASRWHEVTGTYMVEGYGLTEASPVVSVNPTHLPPRIGTIGTPLPSTDVRILTEDGSDAPLGEPGELAVRGPQVMRGYWRNEDETRAVLTDDGWLLTGDIATQDETGYFSIVDRKKEIIVVSGFNVYPGDIEDAAMLHPDVLEAGAIPVADDHAGEVPKLFVVRRNPSLTEAELAAFLRERLTGYKRPRHIEFLEELPKTNVGKVLRRALREREEGHATLGG